LPRLDRDSFGMSNYIKLGLNLIWVSFFIYWTVSSFRAKKTVSSEPFVKRFVFYWLPLVIAFALLGPGKWFGHSLIRENFVPHTNIVGFAGLLIAFIGLAIAFWARYLLGANWSATVQQKSGHTLITAGPYKFVRHPIYSALLLMFSGHALIVGDWRAIIAVAIVFVSFWFKLRKEERLMQALFGEQYTRYLKATKALVPGLL
jgi:protein-S-isoprenylcysteine O-methyltransferase Ste14